MSASELAERHTETLQVQQFNNGREGTGKRMSMRARSLMLQLADAGKSQTDIAQVIGCSVSTVCRTLDELGDNRALARRQLEAAAPKLVRTVVNSKDAATALRALGKLDVVREDNAGGGVNIAIAFGQAEALSPPVITLSQLSPQPVSAVSGDVLGAKATPIEGVSPLDVA